MPDQTFQMLGGVAYTLLQTITWLFGKIEQKKKKSKIIEPHLSEEGKKKHTICFSHTSVKEKRREEDRFDRYKQMK